MATDVHTSPIPHSPYLSSGGAGVRGGPLLGVAEVMARYGLRDRRGARRAMDQAGAFLISRRLAGS